MATSCTCTTPFPCTEGHVGQHELVVDCVYALILFRPRTPPKVSRNGTMSPRFSSPRACLALPSSHPFLCIFRACYMFQGQNSNIIESKHSQTSAPYVQFYKIQYIIRTAQSFKGWKPILQGCLAMAHIATSFPQRSLGPTKWVLFRR